MSKDNEESIIDAKAEKAKKREAAEAQKAEKRKNAKLEKARRKACAVSRRKENKAARRAEKLSRKEKRRVELEAQNTAEEIRRSSIKYTRERDLEAKLREIASKQKPTKCFLKLDNAALIFPASENADLSNMFRLSVLMKEDVKPISLQKAVNAVIPRFPGIAASLKRGAFWFYLEPSYKPVIVKVQRDFPCRKLSADGRNALFRVTYKGKEIAVEFFHPATDGTGGVVFINTLIKAYLNETGVEVADRTNVLNTLDRPRPEEIDDSYQRICDDVTPKQNVDVSAYKISGEKLPATMCLNTTGVMSGEEVRTVARARGETVGELLAAVLIWSIEKDRDFRMISDTRPIVIAMPVNLRKLFPSKTLRNFVGQIPVKGIGLKPLEEIEKSVAEQLHALNTREYFVGFTNTNIKLQKNLFFKIVPRNVKTVAMKLALKLLADRVTTMSFSNLGQVAAPEEFKQHVVRYDFILGPHKKTLMSASSICFNDVLSVNLGRDIKENGVAKYFFPKLAELGINVTVESNYEVEE